MEESDIPAFLTLSLLKFSGISIISVILAYFCISAAPLPIFSCAPITSVAPTYLFSSIPSLFPEAFMMSILPEKADICPFSSACPITSVRPAWLSGTPVACDFCTELNSPHDLAVPVASPTPPVLVVKFLFSLLPFFPLAFALPTYLIP